MEQLFGIKVEASREVTYQIDLALRRIYCRAPDDLAVIQAQLGRIVEASSSAVKPDEVPPTFYASARVLLYSLSWCASSIFHDACHARLYRDHEAGFGRPVPGGVWTGVEVELYCIQRQIDLSRRILAPAREVRYLQSLNGRHATGIRNW